MAKGEYFSSKMRCEKGTEKAAMPSDEFDASRVNFFLSILLTIRMSVFKNYCRASYEISQKKSFQIILEGVFNNVTVSIG